MLNILNTDEPRREWNEQWMIRVFEMGDSMEMSSRSSIREKTRFLSRLGEI